MEASVAAPAGGQASEAAAAAEGAEQQAAQLDPQEVLSRLDAMAGTVEQMRAAQAEAQQAALAQQQVADGDVDDDLDLSWLDPEGAQFDPEQFQRNMVDLIRTQQQRAAQEAAAPALEMVAQLQRQQQAQALRTEFPEIGQPETAESVMAGAQEYANAVLTDIAPQLKAAGVPDQIIQAIGQGLVSSPATWRAVYLGAKGLDAAKGEQPIDQAAGLLEGGSGPRPAAQQQPDPAMQIVSAGGGGLRAFS